MKLPQDAVICIPSTTVFTRSEVKPFTTGSAETPPAFCRDTPVIRVKSAALSLVVLTTPASGASAVDRPALLPGI